MNQCGKDGIQDVIEACADILRQEAQDEISVLLQESVLPPVTPVRFGVRQMLRAVQLDHHTRLWALLMLELWFRTWIDGAAATDAYRPAA